MYKTVMTVALTLTNLRRTLDTMLAGFDAAFAQGKELVADFRANEKVHLSRVYREQETRREPHKEFHRTNVFLKREANA